MSTCAVWNCDEPPVGAFQVTEPDQLQMDVIACAFHLAALNAGETYTWDFETNEIRLGADTPPEVLNVIVSDSVGSPSLVTIIVGTDGVETAQHVVRYTPRFGELMRGALEWIDPTDPDAPM